MTPTVPEITDINQLDLSKSYTYADYLTWKFDEFVELIRGKVVRHMAGANRRHQKLSSRFVSCIDRYLADKPCEYYYAPFDVRLATAGANGNEQITTVVQPDILVVCDLSKLDDQGCVGPPDWVIEIVSPGNTAHDTRTKYGLYEESGVREYWIAYPKLNSLAVYVLDENGRYQLRAEYGASGPIPVHTLPGLVLDWNELFDNI